MEVHAEAVEYNITTKRDDGTGCIEVPIMRAGVHTAVTGADVDVTAATFAQVVKNFAAFGGPVPIGTTPHAQEFLDRAGPSPGFVNRLWVDGDMLWAELDLGRWLYESVVVNREWRGFSVEMAPNFERAGKVLPGYTLTGGVFTNRPQSKLEFRLAAEAASVSALSVFSELATQHGAQRKESEMTEQTIPLATHEEKVGAVRAEAKAANDRAAALDAQHVAAQAELKTLRAELAETKEAATKAKTDSLTATARANTLEAENKRLAAGVRDMTVQVSDLNAKIKTAEDAMLTDRVKQAIHAAVAAGVPPAVFDGHEANPADWLHANYATFEAFEGVISALTKATPKPTKLDASTRSLSKESSDQRGKTDEPDKLSAEEKAALEAEGVALVPEYIGVRDAETARKVRETLLAQKAK